MFEYGFEAGIDYVAVNIFVKHENGIGGTTTTEFALTLDCAKEISMIQRSEKGKEVRRYFLKCDYRGDVVLGSLTVNMLYKNLYVYKPFLIKYLSKYNVCR